MAPFLLPHDSWDSDVLLRTHLNCLPTPTCSIDRKACYARLHKLKRTIRDFEAISLASPPSPQQATSDNLSALRFRAKILSWVLFPINDLPIEILKYVFQLVIRDVPEYAVYNRYRLTLSWVSRYWREVTVSTPDIWSTIWVRETFPFNSTLEFLRRAKSAPLDLRIGEVDRHPFDGGIVGYTTRYQLDTIMDALLSKIHTIRSFLAVFNTWDNALHMVDRFNSAELEASSLESFALHHMGYPYISSLSPSSTPKLLNQIEFLPGRTPRLMCLGLNGLSMNWDRIMLSNLISLDLQRIPELLAVGPIDIRTILQECRNLYRLALSYPLSNTGNGPQCNLHLKIPTLRELVLGNLPQHYIVSLLSRFDAPNLMCLDIRHLADETGDIRPTFACLTGKFPRIKLLIFHDVMAQPPYDMEPCIIKFYQSIPELEILKISMVSDNILCPLYTAAIPIKLPDSSIHPMNDPGLPTRLTILCPKLRTLRFGWVNVDIIKAILKERNRRGHRFHNVYALPSPPDAPSFGDFLEIQESVDSLHTNHWLRIPEEWALYDLMSAHLGPSTRALLYTNVPGFSPRR